MSDNLQDPGFVTDFIDRNAAILAVHLIVTLQKEGQTYPGIVGYPGFKGLFQPSWQDKNLSIKVKNMVRDVRESKHSLKPEWQNARKYFLGNKKKKR